MKKLLCAGLSTAILMSNIAMVNAASTFSDLDSVAWAAEYIEEMADMGFIAGYEDGTFRPNKDVTHLEGLVLFSRAMGSNSEAVKEIKEYAVEKYGDIVDEYNISFGKEEVCFMLYRGALAVDELDDYIGKDVCNKPMTRHEAAVVITKAMSGEKKAKAEVMVDLTYEDADEIPAASSKYVYYTTENGIMNGMEGNIFSPYTNVKRSQIAVMLSRAVNSMGISFFDTQIDYVDSAEGVVETAEGTFEYTADTIMYVEGQKTDASSVPKNVNGILTFLNDELIYVDALASEPDAEVEGVFQDYFSSNDLLNLQIKPNGSTKMEYFECIKGVTVTRNGEKSTIVDFKKGDFINLKLVNGKVTEISAEQKIVTIEDAVISDISIDNDVTVTIEHEDEEYNGKGYGVVSDVAVIKNGAAKDLTDIFRGDKVTLTLEYGQITKIVAQSTKKTVEGNIREIHISSTPYMVVAINGTEHQYDIPSSVSIKINGETATIYDFRLGDTVKITIESQAITAISATSVQSGTHSITAGVVSVINSSYGFIKVSYEENGITKEETVMCKDSSVTVVDATGKTSTLKNVKVGDVVTIRGTMNNGAFVASVILIESK